MTKNQLKVISYIVDQRIRFGVSPTIREIVAQVGLSGNSSALCVVKNLIKAGYLTRGEATSRSLIPTKEALQEFGTTLSSETFEHKSEEPVIKQPKEFSRDSAAVSNPTVSLEQQYGGTKIEVSGTSIKSDINILVESVIILAFGKYFNGTSNTIEAKQNLVTSISNILFKTTEDREIFSDIEKTAVLGLLTLVNYLIFKEVWASVLIAMLELVFIKKRL